ncbi:MAG: hypothetical protein KIS66_15585 [Fimbriimonadaceae bacterium]|nr:hypothetical protein [Fimbriimonadaceae bacterium]
MRQTRSSRCGGTLLSVLVFSAISISTVAVVGLVSVAHVGRSRAEAAHARALFLAEAGINYEIDWISTDPTNPNRAHQKYAATGQPGPATVSLTGGTFTVSVVNQAGTGNWTVGQPMQIVSKGVADGVSRTVMVRATPDSTFSPVYSFSGFAMFGTNKVTITGTGSRANGSVGTNGTFTATSGASQVNGALVYFGSTPGVTGALVYRQTVARAYERVDDIVRREFPNGWTTLKTSNSNDKIRRFRTTAGSWNDTVLAGFTKSTYVLTNTNFHVSGEVYNMNTADKPRSQGGTRYCTQDQGLYNKLVLIFPPGDYYFENWGVTYDYKAILVDNAAGPVRFWFGGTNASNDNWCGPTFLTNPADPGSFRVYYGKAKTLTVSGTADMPGLFYGVNQSTSSKMVASGGTDIKGAFIGTDVTISSASGETTTITYPSGVSMSLASDPVTGYRFGGYWREIRSNGGPGFADDTTY